MLALAGSLSGQTGLPDPTRVDASSASNHEVEEERVVVGSSADLSKAFGLASKSFVKVQITPRFEGVDAIDSDLRPSVVSGFVLDAEGTVVTVANSLANYHAIVVERIDGVVQLARVIGTDLGSNLAVLEIDPDASVVLTLGEPKSLLPGAPVLAIGNPYDLGPSANVGHISAVNRAIRDEGRTRAGLIQLNLPLHPGEQGGPLIDASGRVVGMVMTLLELGESESEAQGISFALPIDIIVDVTAKVRERSSWAKQSDQAPFPFLGVRAADIEDPALRSQAGLGEGEGCVIEVVFPDTGAAAAGLRPFDVLTHFDGVLIRGTMGLGAAIHACEVDQTVTIRVLREGATIDVPVTLRGRH